MPNRNRDINPFEDLIRDYYVETESEDITGRYYDDTNLIEGRTQRNLYYTSPNTLTENAREYDSITPLYNSDTLDSYGSSLDSYNTASLISGLSNDNKKIVLESKNETITLFFSKDDYSEILEYIYKKKTKDIKVTIFDAGYGDDVSFSKVSIEKQKQIVYSILSSLEDRKSIEEKMND